MQVISVQSIIDRPIIDAIATNDFLLIGDASDGNAIKRVSLATLRAFVLAGFTPSPSPSPSPSPQTVLGNLVPNSVGNVSGGGYTVGMKFRAVRSGLITAIRYYCCPNETGSHIGRIWSSDGIQLAEVTFDDDNTEGWKVEALPTPLAISANTVYTVSVNMNSRYPSTNYPSRGDIVSGDLIADNRGVFGLANEFPTSDEGGATTYFRDVVFE